MKKTLIQLIACFLLLGCAGDINEEDLKGEWVLEGIDGDISKVIPTVMQDAAKEKPTIFYHFQADNKLTYTSMSYPYEQSGYYEVKLDSNLLLLHLKGTEGASMSTLRFEIIELNRSSMKWRMDIREDVSFIHRLKRK